MAAAPNRAHFELKALSGEDISTLDPAAAASIFLRAVKMKTAMSAKKPPMARKAKSMLRRDSARVTSVTTAPAANTPPVSSTDDPRNGPSVVPSELKNWEKLSRACDPVAVPRPATRGLAATCSRVTPEAMTNNASNTPGYQSRMVATGTIRQPATMVANAAMTARL